MSDPIRVCSTESWNQGVYRTPCPGGWLVFSVSPEEAGVSAPVFVEDRTGEWLVEPAEPIGCDYAYPLSLLSEAGDLLDEAMHNDPSVMARATHISPARTTLRIVDRLVVPDDVERHVINALVFITKYESLPATNKMDLWNALIETKSALAALNKNLLNQTNKE